MASNSDPDFDNLMAELEKITKATDDLTESNEKYSEALLKIINNARNAGKPLNELSATLAEIKALSQSDLKTLASSVKKIFHDTFDGIAKEVIDLKQNVFSRLASSSTPGKKGGEITTNVAVLAKYKELFQNRGYDIDLGSGKLGAGNATASWNLKKQAAAQETTPPGPTNLAPRGPVSFFGGNNAPPPSTPPYSQRGGSGGDDGHAQWVQDLIQKYITSTIEKQFGTGIVPYRGPMTQTARKPDNRDNDTVDAEWSYSSRPIYAGGPGLPQLPFNGFNQWGGGGGSSGGGAGFASGGGDNGGSGEYIKFLQMLADAQKAFSKITGSLGDFGAALHGLAGDLADYGKMAGDLFKPLTGPVGNAAKWMVTRPTHTTKNDKGEDVEEQGASPLESMLGGIGATALVVVGAAKLAATAVQAINPGLVDLLNATLRDLTAVIGTALEPVLAALVPVIRNMADLLLPVAQMLAEQFKTLMAAIAPLLNSILETGASILRAFMPLVDLLVTLLVPIANILAVAFKSIAIIVQYAGTILSGWVELLKSVATSIGKAFGINFTGLGDSFVSALRKMTNFMLLAAASVAKFFGATSFISGMLKSLEVPEKKSTIGYAALQNASFQSSDALYKDIALKAAVSTMGTGGPTEEEKARAAEEADRKEMIKSLDSINKGLPMSIADALVTKILKVTIFGEKSEREQKRDTHAAQMKEIERVEGRAGLAAVGTDREAVADYYHSATFQNKKKIMDA